MTANRNIFMVGPVKIVSNGETTVFAVQNFFAIFDPEDFKSLVEYYLLVREIPNHLWLH